MAFSPLRVSQLIDLKSVARTVDRIQDQIQAQVNPVLNTINNSATSIINGSAFKSLGKQPVYTNVVASISGVTSPSPGQFGDGWINNGGTVAVAAFSKDLVGVVRIKGVVKNNTAGGLTSTIFVLPVGYRPKETQRLTVMGAGGTFQAISIDLNGVITPVIAVAAGATCDLACSFIAEQ